MTARHDKSGDACSALLRISWFTSNTDVLVSSITLDYYYTATERLVDFLCSIVRSNLCSIINKIIISELDMEKALV